MKMRITVNGEAYDVDVEMLDKPKPAGAKAKTAAPTPAVPPDDPSGRSHAPAPILAHDGKRCVSPLPGTVLKVEVQVGDQVKTNQTLLVLDAMKMETNVPSAVDGRVRAVHVQAGAAVKQGDLLVELE